MAKILIADDADTLRSNLRKVLEAAGHEVIEAVDGIDALRVAEMHTGIELIITDYNMPGIDGLSMIRRFREIERYAKVPVGVLTTESSRELKAAGKEVGVIVWFVKPFDGKTLITVVEKILATK